MNQIFKIGTFCFCINADDRIIMPDNFMKFKVSKDYDYKFIYTMCIAESLPKSSGKLIVERENQRIYQTAKGEERYISDFTPDSFWGAYQDISDCKASITILEEKVPMMRVDTFFVSLLMLEKQMIKDDGLILHCAYTIYKGKSILFSAPSQTGKSTQAGLWEKYRNSYTVNGDRALLQKVDHKWYARSWPVCGSSKICNIKDAPIRAIVMLRQGKVNQARRLPDIQAFTELYAQITSNKWNRNFVQKVLDDLQNLIGEVQVWQLTCDISEEAVICLENALYNK